MNVSVARDNGPIDCVTNMGWRMWVGKVAVRILVLAKYIWYRYWRVAPVQKSLWLGRDVVSHAPPHCSPAVACLWEYFIGCSIWQLSLLSVSPPSVSCIFASLPVPASTVPNPRLALVSSHTPQIHRAQGVADVTCQVCRSFWSTAVVIRRTVPLQLVAMGMLGAEERYRCPWSLGYSDAAEPATRRHESPFLGLPGPI
jgi:hypothetical protein